MPPAPRAERISYGPRRTPGCKDGRLRYANYTPGIGRGFPRIPARQLKCPRSAGTATQAVANRASRSPICDVSRHEMDSRLTHVRAVLPARFHMPGARRRAFYKTEFRKVFLALQFSRAVLIPSGQRCILAPPFLSHTGLWIPRFTHVACEESPMLRADPRSWLRRVPPNARKTMEDSCRGFCC